MLQVIDYTEALKPHIKTLNYEWLQKYFEVEPNDEIQLADPQQYILDKGGYIYFAQLNDKIVGTASLIKVSDTEFELAKMAVTETNKNAGIGKALLEHCIKKAETLGIAKLILYSNTSLSAAIHVYKKYGFIEVPLPTDAHYKRANIKMEKVFT